MHLIDEVHLVATLGRRVLNIVEQLAGVFDLGPRGGVDLDQVDEAALVDGLTAIATATGGRGHAFVTFSLVGAIEALGQDTRQGRLADTSGPGEQVGMVQAALVQGIDQRPLDMLLPHQFMEGARPPFAGQYLIAH